LLGVVLSTVVAGLVSTTSAGATSAPAPRAATVAGSLTASATSVLAGSSVELSGKLPPRKSRPVVLQQSVGGRWVPLADRSSSARGGFRFMVQISEGTSRYRVSAPRKQIGGTTYPAVVTPKVTVTGQPGNDCATPPQSLAVVRPGITDYSVRTYGQPPAVVGHCDEAPDTFEPWWGYTTSVGGSYFTAVDGNGRLVEMVAGQAEPGSGGPLLLAVTVRDPLTYAALSTKTTELGSWGQVGSVLRATDGDFFVLQGRANLAEDPEADVLRLRRYSSNLELEDTALVKSGIEPWLGVRRPFNAGTASMAESQGTLVIHLAREMNKSDDNVNHQANLTLRVDTASMGVSLVPDDTYTSHSFNQLVTANGNDAVFLDHGDAYPRSLVITVLSDFFTGTTGSARHEIWQFPGAVGNNYTGTTVNGLVTGTGHALSTGVSVPHNNAVGGVTGSGSEENRLLRNAYVISTDLGTGASVHRWLTTYNPNSTAVAVTEPRIVKVAEDTFVALFGVRTTTGESTEYRLLDPAGTVIGTASFPGLPFQPLADPMVSGSRLFWEGAHQWDDGPVRRGSHHLFGFNISNPAAPQLLAP
jgi:hypothetical protein